MLEQLNEYLIGEFTYNDVISRAFAASVGPVLSTKMTAPIKGALTFAPTIGYLTSGTYQAILIQGLIRFTAKDKNVWGEIWELLSTFGLSGHSALMQFQYGLGIKSNNYYLWQTDYLFKKEFINGISYGYGGIFIYKNGGERVINFGPQGSLGGKNLKVRLCPTLNIGQEKNQWWKIYFYLDLYL